MFVEVINFLFEIISHSGRTEEDEYQPPNLPPPLSWESKMPGLRVGDGLTHAAGKGSERAERGEEKKRRREEDIDEGGTIKGKQK